MPFIQSKNIVVEKEVLPEITSEEKKDKPLLSSLVMLQGGQGGSFGEKSYKPRVILANADILSSELSLNSAKITPCSTTEIKSENDCGYAINFKTDASNQCDFNIGEYNPYNNLNIYNKSQLLSFSDLYTGGVSSASSLSSGSAVGNFTLMTNSDGAYYLTPQLDSELNLNKYYLELRNTSSINDPYYLQKSINFADVGSSVFVFYVTQTDLVSGYATYNTGIINFNQSDTSTTGGFYNTLFDLGDIIDISHPSGYYRIQAEITAKDAITNIYTFNIDSKNNLPSTNSIVFPLGSSVSIVDPIGSNKLSICSENVPANSDLYNDLYSNNAYGLQFNIQKQVTTDHKEISNSVFFSNDKKLLSESAVPLGITSSFSRIGNRKYMQDQYGTDLTKNQIKNKSKFNIFYHGLERLLPSNNNTSQAVTIYNCGTDVASFVSNGQINQDILGPLIQNGKTIKLIIGSPLKKITGKNTRCYYSNRIYEVLVYIDLKSSDIEKVLLGLSKKYSQKTSFSSPVEFQTTDMYYSITDKINILGKIKKTST